MENKNLKNIFIAAGMAVFAGVLTLGVNAAFGLESPSEDPSAAALHSPVFAGLDLQGSVQNSKGGVKVDDDLQITGKGVIDGETLANGVLNVGGLTTLGADLVVKKGLSNASISVNGAAGYGNLLLTPDTISNFDRTLILQNGKSKPVQIGTISSNSNLTVNGIITATKTMEAKGNFKALHIGDFMHMSSTKAVPSTQGLDFVIVICPTNYKVVSCYPTASARKDLAGNMFGRDINFIGQSVGNFGVGLNNTCTVNISVTKDLAPDASLDYSAKALCYNPAAFFTNSY